MAVDPAEMGLASQGFSANLEASWDWIQAALPLFDELLLSAMAGPDLSRKKFAFAAKAWVASLPAKMVPALQYPAAKAVARENPSFCIKIAGNGDVAAKHRLGLHTTEAADKKKLLARTAGASVARSLTGVAAAGKKAFAGLAAG